MRSLLVALLLLFASSAYAEDATLSATNTFTAEVRGDNQNGTEGDDDYTAVINRLTLKGVTGALSAGLRVDAFGFSPSPTPDFEDDVILERFELRFRQKPWTLVGGDFYQQLGRGIALSMRKEDQASTDTTLQGGLVELKTREHHAAVFGGRANPANLDEISQHFIEDTNDVMAGGLYDFTQLEAFDTGVYGVFITPTEKLLGERTKQHTEGIYVDLNGLTKHAALYLEVDLQHRELLGQSCSFFEEDCSGKAAYAALDLSFGDFSVLAEGITLEAFEQRGSRNTALNRSFEYNQPPTLERIDQEVSPMRDVQGARLKAEVTFLEQDLLFTVDGVYKEIEPDSPARVVLMHGFGGGEYSFQEGRSRLSASSGYRQEATDKATVKTMVHGEADYLQWLWSKLSLHVSARHESRTLEDDPFVRGSALLGVEWTGLGSLTFELGYDTQNPSADVANEFYAGIATLELMDNLSARLVGGTQRGGLRCIAGVCRDYPAFAGVSGTLVARY